MPNLTVTNDGSDTTAVPEDFAALQKALSERYEDLAPRLKQCARYAMAHPELVALKSARELSEQAKVQRSTLVRFAQAFGFDGFTPMQKLFRDHLRHTHLSGDDLAKKLEEPHQLTPERMLASFADHAQKALDHLVPNISVGKLRAAVDLLSDSSMIHLAGSNYSYPIIVYLDHIFSKLQLPARIVDCTSVPMSERVYMFGPDDAVLMACFPPISEDLKRLAQKASIQTVPVVGLSDSVVSPVAKYASILLEIRESELGTFRMLNSSMCVAAAIAIAVANNRKTKKKRKSPAYAE